MDVMKVCGAVVGAIITYVVSNTIITSMVTGTTVGDNLLTGTAPIVIAAGVLLVILKMFLI